MINGFIVDWKLLGSILAKRDSVEQAEFFKAFLHEMKSYETQHQIVMQLTYIRGEFTDDERALMSFLGE